MTVTSIRNAEAPPMVAYTRRYGYVGGVLVYEGVAKSARTPLATDAVWAIKRFTYDVADRVLEEWAGGDSREVNIWNNRAALTYA
jgi:hypothetical protein